MSSTKIYIIESVGGSAYTGGTTELLDGADGLAIQFALEYDYSVGTWPPEDADIAAFLELCQSDGYVGILSDTEFDTSGTVFEGTFEATQTTTFGVSVYDSTTMEYNYSQFQHYNGGTLTTNNDMTSGNDGFKVEYTELELEGLKKRYGYQETDTIVEELDNGLHTLIEDILSTTFSNVFTFAQTDSPDFNDGMVSAFESQEEVQSVSVETTSTQMDTSY